MPPPPPPGLQDVNQGTWLLPVDWVLRILAVLVVAIRLYTRKFTKGTPGWDDAAIALAALVTFVGGGTSNTVKVDHGFGRHAAFLTDADLDINARFLPASQLCNFISLFFTRTSICLFTIRLLPPTQPWPKRLTWAAFVLNCLSTLANCIVFGFACRATSADINEASNKGCASPMQLRAGFAVAGIISVVVDFINVALPIFVIRNLQMKLRTKIGVAIVMSLGLLTAACSIGKVVSVRSIMDPTWDGVPVQVWGSFEENFGIIFASMPALRQLYKHYSSRYDSRGASHPGTRHGDSGLSRTEKDRGQVLARPFDGPRSSSRHSLVADIESPDVGKTARTTFELKDMSPTFR